MNTHLFSAVPLLAYCLASLASHAEIIRVLQPPAVGNPSQTVPEPQTNRFRGILNVFWSESRSSLPSPRIQVLILDPVARSNWLAWGEPVIKSNRHSRLLNVPIQAFGEVTIDPNWDNTFTRRRHANEWLYYMPTNGFCGPMEMRNMHGQIVAPSQPKVCSIESYPSSYTLSPLEDLTRNQPNSFRGLLGYEPCLAEFALTNFFQMKEPGVYKLTIWPKIYERRSPADDTCYRIDIPSINRMVDWKTNSQPRQP